MGLAVAGLAALAVSALVAAQEDPHAGVSSFGQVVSTDGQDRWTRAHAQLAQPLADPQGCRRQSLMP
jgi:hypothetical protein